MQTRFRAKLRAVPLAIAAVLGAMLAGPSGRAAQFGRIDLGDVEDPKQLKKGLETELERISDQVKEAGTKFLDELKKGTAHTDGQKERIDELILKHTESTARLADVEKKLAASKDPLDESKAAAEKLAKMTLGEQVVATKEIESLLSDLRSRNRKSASFAVSQKAITSAPGSFGPGIAPDFRPEILMPGLRKLTIRDLMLPGTTKGAAVTYVKETGFTNSTAPVSETVRKPESTLVITAVTQAVTTLATFAKATVQILEDIPQLQSYIDGRLQYGLRFTEEVQLLKGSGVGNNLNGVYTQASTFASPTGFTTTGNTKIDVLRAMILQVYLALYPATGIVLSPVDWADIETLKDTQGRYLIGNPSNPIGHTIWGLPVVDTMALNAGQALVGAFRPFSQIFDRSEANVVIATENEDDFVNNLITVRAEERLAMAVYRPEAFVKNASF